jgi:CubicO group peptidase (beta-lactamase class C family)
MIHGTCSEELAVVRDTFEANFTNGLEVGASVAVAIEGELVVDLWGGVADEATGRPWEADTIVNVFSSTKPMTGLVALLLADRGDLDLHAPVATYWPEFAANGKEAIEVRHLLGHTSGLSGWEQPVTLDDVCDVRAASALLATQAPWWEPGTASGYHAITLGHLMGEVVQRATGTSLGTILRTELAEPLGADFHIGTGPEHDDRIAPVVSSGIPLSGPDPLDPASIPHRTLANPAIEQSVANLEAFRRVELPACNGHGNARSIVQLQSVIANGGTVGGRTFISPEGVEALFEVQSAGVDLVSATPVRHGIGFGLNGPELTVSPNPRACYWGGWGGSIVINDLDAKMSFAYAMNKMGSGALEDFRGAMLALSLMGALMGTASA